MTMLNSIKEHWPEYLMEAWGLGVFMISACVFGVILFHPDAPLSGLSLFWRNLLMGLAMGLTAVGIFCSPWGKRSGAHINPAVTLTFLRLRKIVPWDAFFYIAAQFAGGVGGVLLSWLILGDLLEDAGVNFVVTVPGKTGAGAGFAAEVIISFLMMTMVLFTANSLRLSRFTPFFAGFLVAFYITFENPFSGMSMNPARSFGSSVVAGVWTGWWIYFIAPPLAMLAASEVYLRARGLKKVYCAKFHHHNRKRCIFKCRFDELLREEKFIEVTREKALFPPVMQIF
ncbi:MAG: aquaporin [Pyrinomonadaceae bacterium]